MQASFIDLTDFAAVRIPRVNRPRNISLQQAVDWFLANRTVCLLNDTRCLAGDPQVAGSAGRPTIVVDGKNVFLYRAMIALRLGVRPKDIPQHKVVAHTCHHGADGCVDIRHLQLVCQDENMRQTRERNAIPLQIRGLQGKYKARCPHGHYLKGKNLVPWQWNNLRVRQCLTCMRAKSTLKNWNARGIHINFHEATLIQLERYPEVAQDAI